MRQRNITRLWHLSAIRDEIVHFTNRITESNIIRKLLHYYIAQLESTIYILQTRDNSQIKILTIQTKSHLQIDLSINILQASPSMQTMIKLINRMKILTIQTKSHLQTSLPVDILQTSLIIQTTSKLINRMKILTIQTKSLLQSSLSIDILQTSQFVSLLQISQFVNFQRVNQLEEIQLRSLFSISLAFILQINQ